jgi:hypothetical protein
MKSLCTLISKQQHSLAYSFMPVALWSATEISNDRTPGETRVQEGSGYA